MRILCLHPYLSMRAVKEMAALKRKGHKVILVYEGLGSSVENGYGDFWDNVFKLSNNNFTGEYYCRRLFPRTYRKSLAEVVEKCNLDIIHSYSMPDTLAVAAIRFSGLPVIFDSRDLSSGMDHFLMEDLNNSILNKFQDLIYKKIIKKFEKEANENSDGRIYSSQEMLDYISRTYKINLHKTVVLENYQTSDYVAKSKTQKLSDLDGGRHLVYSGNIYFDELKKSEILFKYLENHSIHLHIYPTGDKDMINYYKKTFSDSSFIHFHNPLPPKELSNEIKKYDFGLVPHPPDLKVLNIRLVLPNKLFDYLAAGLPIIGRNTYSLKNFIDKYRVGLIYDNKEELVENLLNAQANFKIYPEKFIMENHIGDVINLYEQVMN